MVCVVTHGRAASAPLTIVYPAQGAQIPYVRESFAFGASEPGSSVRVNGMPATTAADGGWIAYVPFVPGEFALHVTATLGSSTESATRTVSVDGPPAAATGLGAVSTPEPEPDRAGRVVGYSPDPESGSRPYGMLAPAPGAATTFTLPVGTPVEFSGHRDGYVGVDLGSDNPRWWIDEHQIVAVPAADAPARSVSSRLVATRRMGREDEFVYALSGRVPFRIDEDPAAGVLRASLYGRAGAAGSFVVHAAQTPIWGYAVRWAGDDLVIDVRRPPAFAPLPAPALRGLLVVVDPGHAPDSGAVGPLGTAEREVNLDIALRLRSKLEALGARVVLTRTDVTGTPLYDRPSLAERLGADALVSVHNNAWPDGVDPATHHGFTIFYFQPHSLALAQAMHSEYRRLPDLPDQGVQVGDFALVRSSFVPAVLTESAFITWPAEEMRLRTTSFRDQLAATMATGLERWAQSMRALTSAPKTL